MVDACRRDSGPFDHLPHFVHQAQANLAVSLVLDNASDAVQVEPNWLLNDLEVHSDDALLGLLGLDSPVLYLDVEERPQPQAKAIQQSLVRLYPSMRR